MSRHIRNPGSYGTSSYSQMQDWVEVSGRGILSLIGFVLLGLMIWAFGFAGIKTTATTLTQLTGPALREFSTLGGAKAMWAAFEGVAMGLFVLLLKRGWQAMQRKSRSDFPQTSVRPQIAPSLLAGVAVGLTALAAGIGILPTVMETGGEFDLTTGVPALLDATHIIALGAGGGAGGPGAGGPEIDLLGGYAAILALLVMLVCAGLVAGGAIGGSCGAIGLGALSGATEGATTSGLAEKQRAGALESALSGAVTGALGGGLAAVVSLHLAGLLAEAEDWGPLVGFDVMAAIFAALLMLLCRRSWDNPTGVLGNTVEAAKFVIVLIQYGLGLALAFLMLAGVIWVWKLLTGS